MREDLNKIKIVLGVFLFVGAAYLFYILSNILIPLVLAIFIGLLLQPMMSWFHQRKVPYIISFIIILAGVALVFSGIGKVIGATANSFIAQREVLGERVRVKMEGIRSILERIPGLDLQNSTMAEVFNDMISLEWILSSIQSVAGSLGDLTGLLFMTLIYMIAVMGAILNYKRHLSFVSGTDADHSRLVSSFETVQSSVISYLKVKTFISFLTGLGFYLTCLAFGIEFAIFWGFLAFLLNYIPTFGSIMATAPPAMMGIIQLDGIGSIIFLILVLVVIQNIFGNIIEPLIQGERLSLNTVTVIFGLVFWGYLWGAIGMLLSVPLMVLLKVILKEMPDAGIMVRLMEEPPKAD